ncbi:MAG: hypothetical protein ACR2KQ_11235 [Actinomycetota bacterium]
MRKLIPVVLISCLALPFAPASAESPKPPKLVVGKKRYVQGHDVKITLVNDTNTDVTYGTPWRIENTKGEIVAAYHWDRAETTLAPGESVTWSWDGTPNQCSREGCTKVGGVPAAGKYFATVDVRNFGEMQKGFLTGRYFTLGFESRPNTTFEVFVARQKAVDQMRAEAQAEDKTLIVSGIIRLGRQGYNKDWSFYMGPRSIVLGEMFIEVCDGSPYYVQRHRRDWNGDRWCPWSSYVKRMGR